MRPRARARFRARGDSGQEWDDDTRGFCPEGELALSKGMRGGSRGSVPLWPSSSGLPPSSFWVPPRSISSWASSDSSSLRSGCFFLPVAAYLWRGGFDLARTLSLRFPSRLQTLGGIVVLAGGLQLALMLAWLQSLILPVPTEYLEAISDTLTADSLLRYLWLLVLAAAAPAVVEETLFRGIVLSACRGRLPTAAAVVVVGLVFGLFHLTPETAFRFLPTAWLGIVLGWIVVVSGSLPLSVLLHFLNNAFVLTLTALPIGDPAGSSVDEGPPYAVMVTGPVIFLWGLSILRRAGRTSG